MSSVKKKISRLAELRISQLEDKNVKEVWVLNCTKPKGVIALEVKNRADGSPTVITIPPTWVPVNLTDQVPKVMLIDSPRFRAIISGGHVKLLDPAGVAEVLLDPEVAEEVNAIRNKTAEFFQESIPDEAKAETVHVAILDILSREASNSITENEAKDVLNNREEELTDEDIEYLLKNSNQAKVKKWATDTLADRQS